MCQSFHLILCFSKYLEDPPEPLSLRLSSNLMVGITRIYGQQWTTYYTDVTTFISNMTVFRRGKSVDMPVQKASYEAITIEKSKNLDFNLDDPVHTGLTIDLSHTLSTIDVLPESF